MGVCQCIRRFPPANNQYVADEITIARPWFFQLLTCMQTKPRPSKVIKLQQVQCHHSVDIVSMCMPHHAVDRLTDRSLIREPLTFMGIRWGGILPPNLSVTPKYDNEQPRQLSLLSFRGGQMSSELQLDVHHLNWWRRHLVNAYEVKIGYLGDLKASAYRCKRSDMWLSEL